MNDKDIENVKVLDLATGEITVMPKSELAAGMLRIRLGEGGEIVWADSAQLTNMQKIARHPPFEGALKEKIIFIEKTLADVYPMTYKEWEDGFRCDLHADREIDLWVHLSTCLNAFLAEAQLGLDARKEAFNVLCACMNGTPTTALELVRINVLDRPTAQRLIDLYFESK